MKSEKNNMTERGIVVVVLLLCCLCGVAQQRVVVADADSHEPIAHASLYTKVGGRFFSAITDDDGRAVIGFDFGRLTVSHLNYEQQVVSRIADSIFLKPRFRATPEVVVTNEEPAWIRQKLREVVRTKGEHYFSSGAAERFVYETQSMGTNRIYRYRLTGVLQQNCNTRGRCYAFLADSSIIVASDSTRLTDVQNLRRMLYEDFVDELSNGFIRSHRWRENPDYVGGTDDEIELTFRSKHRNDDRGRVVIDTARCVILQASRKTGTKTNVDERIPAMLYGISRMLTGYKVVKWERDYRVIYGERPDGSFYPQEIRYKTFDVIRENSSDPQEQEYYEKTGGGFPNMEAVLTISPAASVPTDSTRWEMLPRSWYIRLSSDAERQREIELSAMPATFVLYNE